MLPVSQPIYGPHQPPFLEALNDAQVPAVGLARESEFGNAPLNQSPFYFFHFFTVTVVP